MSPAFIKAEMALFAAQAKDVDIIITTALIPNRPAPILITEEMVKSMKKGSVIVDLAAENGGNCALTEPGQVVERHGVHIIGYIDLPSRLAPTASLLYGNNLTHLLADLGGASHFHIDLDDEVVRGALVLHDGELLWPPPPRPPAALPPAPKAAAAEGRRRAAHAAAEEDHRASPDPSSRSSRPRRFIGLGLVAPPAFLSHLTVFALACIVGWQVVWNVTPALHTPLMSVTNAISGIIVIGGMLQVSGPPTLAGRDARRRRDPARDDQHRRRLPRHAAHAADVPPLSACLRPSSPSRISPPGCCSSSASAACRRRSRRGAATCSASLGMVIAVLVTALGPRVASYTVLAGALAVGGAIGAVLAARVEMTSMPQLVAILHSFVGAGGGARRLRDGACDHAQALTASKRASTTSRSSSASSSARSPSPAR